jgi:hypothetical protein
VRRLHQVRLTILATALWLIAVQGSACRTTGHGQGVPIDPAGQRYFSDGQCAAIGLLCVPEGPGRAPFRWAYVDAQLGELGEPSMQPGAGPEGESYRVVIVTSFDGRAIIRLAVQPDGGGDLLLWNPDGYCSNLPVDRAEPRRTTLGAAETDDLLAVIAEASFWTLADRGDAPGLDGTDWYVEGRRSGEHRIVLRSSPGGAELPRVAEAFTDAAGCDHRPIE